MIKKKKTKDTYYIWTKTILFCKRSNNEIREGRKGENLKSCMSPPLSWGLIYLDTHTHTYIFIVYCVCICWQRFWFSIVCVSITMMFLYIDFHIMYFDHTLHLVFFLFQVNGHVILFHFVGSIEIHTYTNIDILFNIIYIIYMQYI